jgi:pilus assembly protein CpaF
VWIYIAQKEKLMTEQETPQMDLELRMLNKVLAQLYLGSNVPAHPKRAEALSRLDEQFGIERPSASEMRQLIEERSTADQDLGSPMHSRIIEELVVRDLEFRNKGHAHIEEQFNAIPDEEKDRLTEEERQRLLDAIVNDVLGFGPLEPLLADARVTEILVDGPHKIYVERSGRFEDVVHRFRDDEHLMRYVRRILAPTGRRLDARSPIVDSRLPDGSRVNVVLPPISLVGPVLTIRKFLRTPPTVEDLIQFGTWSPPIVEFLRACVHGRLNIAFVGGTGSGKTTLLNIMAGFISDDERIIAIQNADELTLRQKRVVKFETRPPNYEGKGEVTMRDLVATAVRMRPDRIIAGELRSEEALDFFQAMNTGHDGCMMTAHANSPRDVLTRLETMMLMANPALPLLNARETLASALDLIVHIERLSDGSRKVLKVTEVGGLYGDVIALADIFVFEQSGIKEGKITGHFAPTGHVPKFMEPLRVAGIQLPLDFFTPV